jgi:hypothetical protein
MMPPPSPAVTERVNNPECRVAILSLDQLRVWVPHLLVAVDEVIKCGSCLLHCIVRLWPIATDRILLADRRFRGITDMAGAAAGRTRTRMTQSGHRRADFAVTHNAAPTCECARV